MEAHLGAHMDGIGVCLTLLPSPENTSFVSTESSIYMHEKSGPQAVLRRLTLTLHAARRVPYGAWRLVLAMSAWSVKADVLRVLAL